MAMARNPTLKVFRTPIGFHDAYVAAPSQKAALDAWGTDTNLFARGAAEIVTDPALTREPLENPGQVIKRSRGSLKDQLASLADEKPAKGAKVKDRSSKTKAAARPKPATKEEPRPSRAKLEEAEGRLNALISSQAEAENELRDRERAIVKERQAFDRARERELKVAERAIEKERTEHSRAIGKWLENQ